MQRASTGVMQIAGAGPAGLAAAITLAHAGERVVVHEARPNVGWRFGRDLQGLENWTTSRNVLHELKDLGIVTSDFTHHPCCAGKVYDAWGEQYEIKTDAPLFYLVERGPLPGSLDHALLKQAKDLGVEVRFRSRMPSRQGWAISATGPQSANAIAVGYHFDTDMENGFWVICDDDLAPGGYAYLLILDGHGTVKSCMFSGFSRQQEYVKRTVSAFEDLAGLEMANPSAHGGIASFQQACDCTGEQPIAGEQAGFQDRLWGFGMRHAIRSGVLAAQCLLSGDDYYTLWQGTYGQQLRTSMVNRAVFGRLGNRGYRFFLRGVANSEDVRGLLRRQYNGSWIKSLLFPLARLRLKD